MKKKAAKIQSSSFSEELEDYGFDPEIISLLVSHFKNLNYLTQQNEDKIKDFFVMANLRDAVEDEEDLDIYRGMFLEFYQEQVQVKREKRRQKLVQIPLVNELIQKGISHEFAFKMHEMFENKQIFTFSGIEDVLDEVRSWKPEDLKIKKLIFNVNKEMIQDIHKEWRLQNPPDETLQLKMKTQAEINKKISKTREILRKLGGSPHENKREIVQQLNFSQDKVELVCGLSSSSLHRFLQNRIETLEKDFQLSQVQDLSESRLTSSVNNGLLVNTYAIRRGTLIRKGSLDHLTESFDFHKQPLLKREHEVLSFSSLETLDVFRKDILKFGVTSSLGLSNSGEKLTLPTQFNHSEELDNLKAIKRGGGILMKSKLTKVITKSFAINLDSLKLKGEMVRSLISIAQIKNEEQFRKEVSRLEDKHGSVINLGPYLLGGFYMLVGYQDKVERQVRKLTKSLIFSKMNDISMLGKLAKKAEPQSSNKKTCTQEERERETIEKKITVRRVDLGDGSDLDTLESFENRLTGSNTQWKVVEQNFQLVYLADLLNLKVNMQEFRKQGLVTNQVLKLKSRMWTFFREKHGKVIQSRIFGYRNFFEEKELNQYNWKFRITLEGLKQNKNVREFLKELRKVDNDFGFHGGHLWKKFKEEDSEALGVFERILSEMAKLLNRQREDPQTLLETLQDFLFVWSVFPEKANQNLWSMYSELGEQQKLLIQKIEIKKQKNQQKQFDFGPVIWRKLDQMYEDFYKYCKQHQTQNISTQLNQILKKINSSKIERQNIPAELTHKLCLFKVFLVSLEKLTLHSSVSLEKLGDFVRFYSKNKLRFEEHFSKTKPEEIEKSLQLLMRENLKFFEYQNIFMTHVQVNYDFPLSERLITRFIFPKTTPSETKNPNRVREQVSDFLRRCRSLADQPRTSLYRSLETLSLNSSLLPYQNSVILQKRAQEICGDKEVLQFYKHLHIVPGTVGGSTGPSWERVLEHVLIRKGTSHIKFLPHENCSSVRECLMALFYLADSNLKRVFVRNFNCSHSPFPFLYSDASCFVAPLTSLSLKYIDKLGHTSLLNPFFHPSLKFSILGSEDSPWHIEDLANGIFYQDKKMFRKEEGELRPNNHLLDTVEVSFLTNYYTNEITNFGELVAVLVNRDPFKALSIKEQFLLDVSNVVFFSRRASSVDNFYKVYDQVKQSNKGRQHGSFKLLVELVILDKGQTDVELDSSEVWHQRIPLGADLSSAKIRIFEFLRFWVNYYNIHSSLRSIEGSVQVYLQKAEEQEKGKGDRVRFDIEQGQFGGVWAKVNHLNQRIRKIKSEKKHLLRLQDFFLKAYSENEQNLRRVRVEKSVRQKNRLFRQKMTQIRLEQLDYIARLRSESPVIIFLKDLLDLDQDMRLAYLVNLESLLVEADHLHLFQNDPDQAIRVVHFQREVGQIFEVLDHFLNLDEFSKDVFENQTLARLKTHLSVLPRLMAELFFKMSPLELLNGELTAVPITWLKAVMEELRNLEEVDPNLRVSVACIMGSQSTGKSTFLNSLFNLTFPTKDGRCTRGSTALMLPVDKQKFSGKTLAPDFVILIDTEGLGSPENLNEFIRKGNEHGMQLRENKMVVFNAGLSNLSIINSYGDFDVQMMDILRMMLFSFIRLDYCKINPLMSMVFQSRDFNYQKHEYLLDTSLSILENMHQEQSRSLQSKRSFRQVLRFKPGRELSMISRIDNFLHFPSEYISAVERYKDSIFSSDFLFKEKEFGSLKLFQDKLEQLNNLLNYENYNFDIDDYLEREESKNVQNFLHDLRTGLRKMLYRELESSGNHSPLGVLSDPKLARQLVDRVTYRNGQAGSSETIEDFWGRAKYVKFVRENTGFSVFLDKIDSLIAEVVLALKKEFALKEDIYAIKGQSDVKAIEEETRKEIVGLVMRKKFTDFERLLKAPSENLEQATRNLHRKIQKLFDYEPFVETVFSKLCESDSKLEFKDFRKGQKGDLLYAVERKFEWREFEAYPSYMKADTMMLHLEDSTSFFIIHQYFVMFINRYLRRSILAPSAKLTSSKKVITSQRRSSNLDLPLKKEFLEKARSIVNLYGLLEAKYKKLRLNIPEVDINYLGRYFLDLVLYSVRVYSGLLNSLVKPYFRETWIKEDFMRVHKEDLRRLFINVSCNFEPQFQLSQNVISLVKQGVAQKANRHLAFLFNKKLQIKMNKLSSPKDVLSQVQIEFLSKSKEVERPREVEFVKELLHFGLNSNEIAERHIRKTVARVAKMGNYANELKRFIGRQFILDVLEILKIISRVVNLRDLKLELKRTFRETDMWQKIDEYMQVDPRISEDSYVDILKNNLKSCKPSESTIEDIFEHCQLDSKEEAIKYFSERAKTCESACFLCRARCTRPANHSGPHCSDHHIPLVFLGRRLLSF